MYAFVTLVSFARPQEWRLQSPFDTPLRDRCHLPSQHNLHRSIRGYAALRLQSDTNSFIYVAASADELNLLFETKPTYIITNVILMMATPNSFTCMHLYARLLR